MSKTGLLFPVFGRAGHSGFMTALAYMILASGIVAFSLLSKKLQASIFTPPMFFMVFGLVMGPLGFDYVPLEVNQTLVHAIAEITLILILFTDAAHINIKELRKDFSLPVRMLFIGMPLTILLGAGVAMFIFKQFTIWDAALLATMLAATDATLSQTVLSSKKVPGKIRSALGIESGLNDGMAVPLVLLFMSLASLSHSVNTPSYWISFVSQQLFFGIFVGAFVGYYGGLLLKESFKRDWISESFKGITLLGLAFIAYTLSEASGGNGFIGAFVAGLTLGNTATKICASLFELIKAEGNILILLTFLAFGMNMVPYAAEFFDVQMFIYAILSLTAIRMIPIAISLWGTKSTLSDITFLGWFGPRGLPSILFALLIVHDYGLVMSLHILTIVTYTVLISVLLHGVSTASAINWYEKINKERR